MNGKGSEKMSREFDFYRETLYALRERFEGRDSITVKELSEYLGAYPQTVQIHIRDGKLPGIKIGKSYSIPLTQLARWEVQKCCKA